MSTMTDEELIAAVHESLDRRARRVGHSAPMVPVLDPVAVSAASASPRSHRRLLLSAAAAAFVLVPAGIGVAMTAGGDGDSSVIAPA
jgi:ABC-type tungstate transport system substrate-binding protein